MRCGRSSAKRFVLDGEIVVPVGGTLSFEELQLRLHPAASRVQKLAAAHPALFVAFDLLLGPRGGPLTDRPLAERREKLEAFAGQFFGERCACRRRRRTRSGRAAWLEQGERGLDGVMAKRLDAPLPLRRAHGDGEGEERAHGGLRGGRLSLRAEGADRRARCCWGCTTATGC